MKQKNTYSKVLIWLLLFVYILTPFRVALPFLNYKINYQYISTSLCENKNKPALHCNGKCYLKKELKKAMDEESAKKEISQKTIETESLPVTLMLDFATRFVVIQDIQFSQFSQSFKSVYQKNCTPPPKA